ncbi:MAG: hypothetical protein KGI50_06095 [Patescibacteria group bacterium]|nr:hypothetical protein [Patescibacteria group bacterium]MDE2439087.1 hypothetical protein [Patescibacteria group bacterium]
MSLEERFNKALELLVRAEEFVKMFGKADNTPKNAASLCQVCHREMGRHLSTCSLQRWLKDNKNFWRAVGGNHEHRPQNNN